LFYFLVGIAEGANIFFTLLGCGMLGFLSRKEFLKKYPWFTYYFPNNSMYLLLGYPGNYNEKYCRKYKN
jgi:hypothetical protein